MVNISGTIELAISPEMTTTELAISPEMTTTELAISPEMTTTELAISPEMTTTELAISPEMTTTGTGGVGAAETNKFVVGAEIQSGIQIISAPNSWDDAWELIHALVVHINASKDEVTIVVPLGMDSQEYGVGSSLDEATSDLLTSLSDYYQFLTKHEK